jgi:hypothetical protein
MVFGGSPDIANSKKIFGAGVRRSFIPDLFNTSAINIRDPEGDIALLQVFQFIISEIY